MTELKKIAVRIGAFLAMLLAMNYCYVFFLFERDLQEFSPIVNDIRAVPITTDVLYLGESSNMTYAETDEDKRKISEMIGDHINGTITDITYPASHAGIYLRLLENVPDESAVQTIVVTLNLRSFSAQWRYSNLESALQKSMVLLDRYPPLLNRTLLAFKEYPVLTEEQQQRHIDSIWTTVKLKFPFPTPFQTNKEWDDYMYAVGVQDSLGNRDWDATALACHYVKGYGFNIDPVHDTRVAQFDAIIAYAKQRNWKVVFNLMAENTDKANALVGGKLIYLMDENRRILIDHFTGQGVKVVDNLTAVRDCYFIDQNWTTEHYTEEGRKIIAKNVAEALTK